MAAPLSFEPTQTTSEAGYQRYLQRVMYGADPVLAQLVGHAYRKCWECEYCRSHINAEREKCTQCGAPRKRG